MGSSLLRLSCVAIIFACVSILPSINIYAESANSKDKSYKSLDLDLSFDYPDQYEVLEWKPGKDKLFSADIILRGNFLEDAKSIVITVFKKEAYKSTYDWIEGNSSLSKETSVFPLFDLSSSINLNKDLKNKTYTFTHTIKDDEFAQIITEISAEEVLAVSYHATDSKVMNSFLAKVRYKNSQLYKSLPELPKVEAKNLMNQSTSNFVTQLSQATSFKLPWKSGISHNVTQGWNIENHSAIEQYAYDFGIEEGNDILSSGQRTVKLVKSNESAPTCGGRDFRANGNYVIINHPDGTATMYLHLLSTPLAVGDPVSQGQIIGKSGKTGWTYCRAHLHFQREAQPTNNWYTQSQPIYFDEYPGLQLTGGGSYTSQNTGIPTSANIIQISGDYAGDSRDDLAFYDSATGRWYIRPTGGGADLNILYRSFQGGIPVGGFNFASTGKDDLVIFNPADGKWYMKDIASGVERIIPFGWATTIPVAGGDYDNDQINDLAIFDKATGRWYIRPSRGGTDWNIQFGWASTVPVPGGDHDHDFKTDMVIYDQTTGIWYIRRSAGGADWVGQFGWSTALPVGGNDYNGDGWADMTIFEPSTGHWYVRPSGGGPDWDIHFGWSTTIPLGGGTYDNNTATDRAIWDKATGRWYIRPSGGGADWNIQFGWTPGVPI